MRVGAATITFQRLFRETTAKGQAPTNSVRSNRSAAAPLTGRPSQIDPVSPKWWNSRSVTFYPNGPDPTINCKTDWNNRRRCNPTNANETIVIRPSVRRCTRKRIIQFGAQEDLLEMIVSNRA